VREGRSRQKTGASLERVYHGEFIMESISWSSSWRVYRGEFIMESWIKALRYGRRAGVQL